MPSYNGIDMESMYAGVYMARRALEDNLAGALEAHKRHGEPEDMQDYIRGKREMLRAVQRECDAVLMLLTTNERKPIEEKVESLIEYRKKQVVPDAIGGG